VNHFHIKNQSPQMPRSCQNPETRYMSLQHQQIDALKRQPNKKIDRRRLNWSTQPLL
jgi:hypothetical protein